jgi:hypothetical protein
MTKRRYKVIKQPVSLGKLIASTALGVALVTGAILLGPQSGQAADVVVYKSPTCGCCKDWVAHMRESGFNVQVHDRYDMSPIKQQMGVPQHLQSCHTASVGMYVIEGHVPADDIIRLLREKPAVAGLSAPGMPMGSPGMEGPRKDPYDVLTFRRDGKTTVYARHNQ